MDAERALKEKERRDEIVQLLLLLLLQGRPDTASDGRVENHGRGNLGICVADVIEICSFGNRG